MVKNDNIEVTQRQPLNLDGIFSLLLCFLRVCEDTFFNSAILPVFLCGSLIRKRSVKSHSVVRTP